MVKKFFLLALFPAAFITITQAQNTLTLKEAVETAVKNYGSIKAKEAYAKSSQASVEQAKRNALPNINFGLQQDFGTAVGQNGPLYSFGGLSISSSGSVVTRQNWNSAFGALYLTNVNWDFFSFGKAKQQVKVAQSVADRDNNDILQEIFQQKIKVAAAYLSLQAAQQLSFSYKRNVDRIDTIRRTIITKALNGLIAGVDSSSVNADYAGALISYTNSLDIVQQQENSLAFLMGVDASSLANVILDSISIIKIPSNLDDSISLQNNPQLLFYKSRIAVSEQEKKYIQTQYYPTFSLAGVLQTRASGFGNAYAQNLDDYSMSYWNGINPTRTNYLFGIGVTWNITQPYRLSQQVKAQNFITKGLQEEYSLTEKQLQAQLQLSQTKWANAIAVYKQVPMQLEAANEAYIQRSALYQNGLATIVDLSQSIFALIQAETDRDIAISNVWQALLLKAAATGNFSLFEDELQ